MDIGQICPVSVWSEATAVWSASLSCWWEDGSAQGSTTCVVGGAVGVRVGVGGGEYPSVTGRVTDIKGTVSPC